MRTIIEDPEGNFLDLEDLQVEWAAQLAAIEAIRRARRFDTEYVIWEDDQVKCLRPREAESYERKGLENLERLSRRIAELKSHQRESELILNDRPPKD
jgi:hypothetical protein